MKKFLVLSSWSRKAIGSMLIMAFAVVGCDDSSSASAGPNDEPGVESSSSSGKVTEPAEETSSSSGKAKSSSSDTQSDAKQSSSSESRSDSSSVETTCSPEEEGRAKMGIKGEILLCMGGNWVSSGVFDLTTCSPGEEGYIKMSLKGDYRLCDEGNWISVWRLSSKDSSVTLEPPCITSDGDSCEYDSLIDERDGKTYKTVKIGNQWWMAENLNFYADEFSKDGLETQSGCLFDNSRYCDEYGYGRYYWWALAMDSAAFFSEDGKGCGKGNVCKISQYAKVRGICPEGWHLPSANEWNILYLATGKRAEHLRTYHEWDVYLNAPSVFGYCDLYGFGALPGTEDRRRVTFLTSDEIEKERAAFVEITYDSFDLYIEPDYKNLSGYIRCVKDSGF